MLNSCSFNVVMPSSSAITDATVASTLTSSRAGIDVDVVIRIQHSQQVKKICWEGRGREGNGGKVGAGVSGLLQCDTVQ